MKKWRFAILLSIVVFIATIIIGRLFYLQVFQGKLYQAQALGQQMKFQQVEGDRGEIFFQSSKDTFGKSSSGIVKSAAINQERWIVSAFPKKISDKLAFAGAVSAAMQIPQESIVSGLEQVDAYVAIKKDATSQEVQKLKDLHLEGLGFESAMKRYYPQGEFASQVVGFFGGDNEGYYGLEGYYNAALEGESGIHEEKIGMAVLGAQGNQHDLKGSDLFLTIDYNIQFQAESLLLQARKDLGIESGQIIVMKPDSGRILAMANFPNFDPNKYSQEKDFSIFQNSTIQKIYEPGSVFKPFIMAMALNEHRITPESTFVDKGSVTVGPDTIYNFNREKYGTQIMSGILEKSINTGAAFLSQTISHSTFTDYLGKLGFDNKTGIDLQGEVHSRNELLKKGSAFGFITASFGQGIEITPLQLVQAFSVFANNGKMVRPYIVEKIAKDQEEKITQPEVSGQIFSEKTASEVTTMLVNVVDRGFGSEAKVKGYYLAGKTGTAEVPLKDGRGYYADRTIQSFIGFGPAFNPQFLILVKLDNPKVPRSALSAAPIFKKLSQYIIDYWQIPPDYSTEQ